MGSFEYFCGFQEDDEGPVFHYGFWHSVGSCSNWQVVAVAIEACGYICNQLRALPRGVISTIFCISLVAIAVY